MQAKVHFEPPGVMSLDCRASIMPPTESASLPNLYIVPLALGWELRESSVTPYSEERISVVPGFQSSKVQNSNEKKSLKTIKMSLWKQSDLRLLVYFHHIILIYFF